MLTAIFVGYAWLWEAQTGAFTACERLVTGR